MAAPANFAQDMTEEGPRLRSAPFLSYPRGLKSRSAFPKLPDTRLCKRLAQEACLRASAAESGNHPVLRVGATAYSVGFNRQQIVVEMGGTGSAAERMPSNRANSLPPSSTTQIGRHEMTYALIAWISLTVGVFTGFMLSAFFSRA